MPLTYLSSLPAVPPALLDHLLGLAGTDDATYSAARLALAENPAVPFERAHALLAGHDDKTRRAVRWALLRRTNLTPDQALSMIHADPRLDSVTDVLSKQHGDPVARYAYETFDSIQVKTVLLCGAGTPTDVVRACARDLTSNGRRLSKRAERKLQSRVRAELRGALTNDEHNDALAWADSVGVSVADRTFTAPGRGSTTWLKHPSTDDDDVCAWATDTAHPSSTWNAILTHRDDPDGTFATAAWELHGESNADIRRRVILSNAPTDIRKQAAWPLLRATAAALRAHHGRATHPDYALSRTWSMLETVVADIGDLDMYEELLGARMTDVRTTTLRAVLSRLSGDLRPEDLDRVCAWPLPHSAYQDWVYLWLALHPAATPAQRNTAADLLAKRWPQDPQTTIAELARTLDVHDPASVAVLADALPVSWLSVEKSRSPFGAAWLLPIAVAAHLPAHFSADSASVLTTLLGAGGSTESIGSVLTTVHAIVS